MVAIDGVALQADRGETVGLLSPNGAGKTATVSTIAGLLRPDSGEVRRSVARRYGSIKRKIGLVPQDIALYDELSAVENLTFFCALYDIRGAKLKRAIGDALHLITISSSGSHGDP